MKLKRLILLFFLTCFFNAWSDSVPKMRIHFLYGSKPKYQYRKIEKKEFGGLHGGHVTIQVNGDDYGFERAGGFHIFPRRKNYKAKFTSALADSVLHRNSANKTVSFIIPLSSAQYNKLNEIHQDYCRRIPYDYAFLGMRCASSVSEILGQIGIIKKRKYFVCVTAFFFPKRLRKKIFRLAKERNYEIIATCGRETRQWERD